MYCLHLVEDDQGEWKLAVLAQCLPDGFEHVIAGDVLDVGIQVIEGGNAGGGRGKEMGLGLHQGCMQAFSHVEIVQFFIPVKAVLLDMMANGLIDTFILEPHDEPSDRILLGKADRFEENPQQRQADAAAGGGTQGSRCCMQSPMTLRLRAQLSQEVADVGWQVGDPTRRGAVLKHRIAPENAKHFDEMGFPGAIKPAHPYSRLLRVIDVFKISFEVSRFRGCGSCPFHTDHHRQTSPTHNGARPTLDGFSHR
jgi:hypothetical protein